MLPTTGTAEWLDLDKVLPPDRSSVEAYRKHYVCLNYMPVWTLETTRGCNHHCKFCSVWQFYKGSCRFHSARNVRADFEHTGKNVFIIDDFFWGNMARSEELARELLPRASERIGFSLSRVRIWSVKIQTCCGNGAPWRRNSTSSWLRVSNAKRPRLVEQGYRYFQDAGSRSRRTRVRFWSHQNSIIDPDFSEEIRLYGIS